MFPPYLSIPINIIGLALMYSIKYFWGRKVGANAVQTILNKSETISYLIQLNDGRGNPWLLALFRLIPGIPINQVSKLYGAMGFKYKYFLILSFIGYSPLLISYTFIGRNVFDPLSTAFLLPLVLLFLLIGISMMAIGKIIKIQFKRRRNSHNV
ncbi:MAG: VTT domain-containing protein [Ruminococcus sp.]|nr:VTT domain-containing protein [Candidatus Copronaster equi]